MIAQDICKLEDVRGVQRGGEHEHLQPLRTAGSLRRSRQRPEKLEHSLSVAWLEKAVRLVQDEESDSAQVQGATGDQIKHFGWRPCHNVAS